MKLYVFSSNSMSNIYAAIGAGLWAVGEQKNTKSKSEKMPIGAMAVIYCSETSEFTSPFIVKSKPKNKVQSVIWKEEWVYPFEIIPLSKSFKKIHKDELNILPSIANSTKPWNQVLNVSPGFAFTPQQITEADWSVLIEKLT